tara:strand:+ start:55 stop:519 length:465 start_codon:yes stop_codon:yes gene_type:complete
LLDIALYEPEIPPNTGNIIRIAANTGARLHLIEPLGFDLSDSRLKRAGLDYHEYAELRVHESLDALLERVQPSRVLPISTRGTRRYDEIRFEASDLLLFGPESRGLPEAVLTSFESAHRLRIPMREDSRSLNLANAVAVVVYEALRQGDFSSLS